MRVNIHRMGEPKLNAIKNAMLLNFKAILFTSLTTVIGFLTLNFNDSPPFHDLGNISAIGVVCALVFSVFTLPALMAITPFRKKKIKKNFNRSTIDKYLEFGVTKLLNYRKTVLFVFAGLSLLFIVLSFGNVFSDNYIKYFSPRIKFRQDTDHIMGKMTGIYNIDFKINGGAEQSITTPEYIILLDLFEQWLYKQEHVRHVNGIHDIIKRVNKSMHNDDMSYFEVPGSADLISQYLLAYEMSVPYGLDLSSQINLDKSASKFSIIVDNISSEELLLLTANAEQWLRDNASTIMISEGASVPIMFAHMGNRQIKGMIKGGLIALILISILLILLLRNFKLGLLSLLPNLLPVFFAFGFWGLFIGQVNSAAAMVFGMTLGVIVDDTVHVLVKYMYAKEKLSYGIKAAITYTVVHVGKAIIATSAILFAGFAVLGFSNFEMNSAMGKMSVLVILAALILDLFFLPILIFLVESRKSKLK